MYFFFLYFYFILFFWFFIVWYNVLLWISPNISFSIPLYLFSPLISRLQEEKTHLSFFDFVIFILFFLYIFQIKKRKEGLLCAVSKYLHFLFLPLSNSSEVRPNLIISQNSAILHFHALVCNGPVIVKKYLSTLICSLCRSGFKLTWDFERGLGFIATTMIWQRIWYFSCI